MQTVLIIGASSGLGEGLARRLHAQGTHVLITGRRRANLESIASSLGNTNVTPIEWSLTDLAGIASKTTEIFGMHPNIDTVILNAGVLKSFSLLEASSGSDADITQEVNTNATAVFLLARAVMPYLLARAQLGKKAYLLATTSGLAYVPIPLYPVYCATKAAVHSFLVSVRQQVAQDSREAVRANMQVCELVPQWVDTAINNKFSARVVSEGKTGGRQPMSLDQWLDDTMQGLAEGEGGRLRKEVATGYSQHSVDLWRSAFDPVLQRMGLEG